MSDDEGNDWEPDLGSLLGGIAVGVVLLGAVWLLIAALSGGRRAAYDAGCC